MKRKTGKKPNEQKQIHHFGVKTPKEFIGVNVAESFKFHYQKFSKN
ncbi:MAG: hypothetical protein ABI288_06945 [Ginsengibacter sp.]